MRRTLVVINPYATTVSEKLRALVVHALASAFDVTTADTEAQGHATEIVRARAADFDLVVALGGDGTVNEVANGLVGASTPMTALPGGSTSVFARLLGYPSDLIAATDRLIERADALAVRAVDLGCVNGRYFTFTSGMGLDASVVARIDANPRKKARLGHAYAAYAGLATAMREYSFGAPAIDVAVDGEPFSRGISVMVQNSDVYSYFGRRPLRVAEGADLQSGTLAGAVLTSSRATVVPGVTRRLLSKRASVIEHRRVDGFSGAREIVLASDVEIPLHVDGDPIGATATARYSVAPAALLVVS